jgi:hypothetical protein
LTRRYLKLASFYFVIVLILTPYGLHELYANDLWKSLYFGRYVSLTGAFPSHAEFAFTPTVSPVPSDVYSWLGHLVIFGIHQLSGEVGLVILRCGLVGGALVLVHSMTRYRISRWLLLVLLGWGIGLTQKTLVRTALFVIPMVTLFWWLFDKGRRESPKWFWAGLPVLFAFWGNLHGSFLYGLGLVILLAIGDGLDSLRGRTPIIELSKRQWVALMIVLFLVVTVFKPYPDTKWLRTGARAIQLPNQALNYLVGEDGGLTGLRALVYQGDAYRGEMRSIAGRGLTLSVWYVPYVICSFLVGGVVLRYLFAGDRRWSLILPVVATFLMGGLYLRFVALIPLTAVPVALLAEHPEDWPFDGVWDDFPTLYVLLILLLTVPWLYVSQQRMARYMHNPQFEFGVTRSSQFSEALPEYVLERYPDRRVFTHYDIGGYLIWRWWPDKRVFIDSKNWAYERTFRNRYLRSSPAEMMAEWDLDLAVFPITSAWNYYLMIPSTEWQLLKYDAGMALYGPSGQWEKNYSGRRSLLTKPRLRDLEGPDRRQLRAFERFVGKHENRPEHVGVFTDPE